MSIIDRRDPLTWPMGEDIARHAKLRAWKVAVMEGRTLWGFGEWCEEMWVPGMKAYENWADGREPSEDTAEWDGHPDPDDPDNFWINERTGDRVRA